MENMKERKLKLFSGGDWRHRGGCLVVVASSVADAARLIALAHRAKIGVSPEEMAKPVEPFDVGRNSRWINKYFGVDANFNSSWAKKIVQERGVWHYKENGYGMHVDEFVRLV